MSAATVLLMNPREGKKMARRRRKKSPRRRATTRSSNPNPRRKKRRSTRRRRRNPDIDGKGLALGASAGLFLGLVTYGIDQITGQEWLTPKVEAAIVGLGGGALGVGASMLNRSVGIGMVAASAGVGSYLAAREFMQPSADAPTSGLGCLPPGCGTIGLSAAGQRFAVASQQPAALGAVQAPIGYGQAVQLGAVMAPIGNGQAILYP